MSRLTLRDLVSLIADELGIDEDKVWARVELDEETGDIHTDPLTRTEWALIVYAFVTLGSRWVNALDHASDVVEKLREALSE